MSIISQSLVLASASTVRRSLLVEAGVSVTTDIARIDEQNIKAALNAEGVAPRDVADALAEAKARRVSSRQPGALVLGADQVLVLENRIFDKPEDLACAREQLLELRGKTHQLLSAAVLMRDGEVTFRHVSQARLKVRDFSDEFLDDYLMREGEEILACVGGYKLEGRGGQLFDRIDGDYFTVLGLPLLEILAHLRLQGYLMQ